MTDNSATDDLVEQQILIRPVVISKIPKKGVRMNITLSAQESENVCVFYQLQNIAMFEAQLFLEKKTTTKLRLSGKVRANIVQTCVLSLEPVTAMVDEEIDMTLVPSEAFEHFRENLDDEGSLALLMESDVPDTYSNDYINVGSYILEYFALGLDPYPQVRNAVFEEPEGAADKEPSPFAKLAVLKDGMEPN